MQLIDAKKIIEQLDLTPIFKRLVQVEKWTSKAASEAICQYRNYLFLVKKYPEYRLAPSREIDEVWHAHILHTREYREFCRQIFPERNGYLDHVPQLDGDEDASSAFKLTQDLYRREFGNFIYQIKLRSWRIKLLEFFCPKS